LLAAAHVSPLSVERKTPPPSVAAKMLLLVPMARAAILPPSGPGVCVQACEPCVTVMLTVLVSVNCVGEQSSVTLKVTVTAPSGKVLAGVQRNSPMLPLGVKVAPLGRSIAVSV